MSDLKVNEIKTDAVKNAAGTTAATIDSTGKINAPVLGSLTRNVVSFCATGPSSYTNYGASGVIDFSDVTSAGFHDNTGGNYSTTNKEFTCAIAGLYQVYAQVLIQSEGQQGVIIQHRNSSNSTIANFHGYEYGRTMISSTLINMSVGDKIRALSENTTSIYLGVYGRFYAYLIG